MLSGAGLGLALLAASYPLLWRDRCLTWGATPDEVASNLRGDELLPDADLVTTKAIAIHAPPDRVWPWLVQMGSGRAGTYTYDWIDNLFGLDMHSANVILPQFLDLQLGDAYPFGSGTLQVEALEPGRLVVTRVPEWNWVRIFCMIGEGDLTRLLLRNRMAYPGRGFASRLCRQLISESAGLLMEPKMLRGIKQRAETEDVWPDGWTGEPGGARLSGGPTPTASRRPPQARRLSQAWAHRKPNAHRKPPRCRSVRCPCERRNGIVGHERAHLLLVQTCRGQQRQELGQQVRVTATPGRPQVITQADVVGEQYLRAEARPDQIKDVVDGPVGVVRRPGADGVERDVAALLDQGQVISGNRNAVGVPDDDAARVDTLLGEQLELREPDRPSGSMRADGQAGLEVRAGGGTKRALLSGRDVTPVGADLADDARADAGATNALGDVADDLVGDRVDGGPVEPAAIQVRVPVMPAAHHDRDPGCLRDPAQRGRIPADLVRREIHERAAAMLVRQHEA